MCTKEDHMVTLILIVVIFVSFDVSALLWGCDSRDGINSAEWMRRQEWLSSRLVHQD